ncbi:MAG: T9SS type A sorting domain-containing protein [Ignavibacteriales bacterium]|nr:MAG: T9SS type A sorting domain-containing protein [Ignavibacteriales bacterium]
MKNLCATVLFVLAFSFVSLAQYNWVLKQSGGSLGGPIDVERDNSNNVYYGFDNKIYKSTNRGESFTQYGINIPGASDVKSIILDDDNLGTLLVAIEGSGDKILKSTDAGASWVITADGLTFSFFGIPMTPDPSHPDTIYTMSNSSFMRSTDFGSTWTTLTSAVGCATPCDIEVFQDTSIILVGDNGTGIFRSTDYGQTWGQVHNTSGEIPTIAVDYRSPGTAWATRWSGGGGLLKSTDYGATWTLQSTFNGINMWGVHVNPIDGEEVYAGCYSCGNTWRTKNGGSNWQQVPISSSNYQVYIVDSMTVFSAQGNGFYKLTSPTFTPVELVSFSASVSDKDVILNWTTASEINNRGFEIERSTDNITFSNVGFVPGFGTSSEVHIYEFRNEETTTGKYYYRLKQIDYDGSYEYSQTAEVEILLPTLFELAQNHPNPFNPSTTIEFSLPVEAQVQLKIFNLLGEKLNVLAQGNYSAGKHNLTFNADGLASGNYLYSIEAVDASGKFYTQTKKMTILK